MPHSADITTSVYQQLQSTSDRATACESIAEQKTDMVLPEEPVLKVKKARRLWLKEEGDILRATFSLTAESSPPQIAECYVFLKTASPPHLVVGRTTQDVMDKCRSIIRQLKKKD